LSAFDTVTAGINLAALVFLGAQVMLARQAIKETADAQNKEWERQRKRSTLEALVSTAQYREELKAVLPWNDRDPKEMARFFEKYKDDHSKLWPVREYLNHLEDLAVGVKQGVFDLETIIMADGNRILDVVVSYGPHIERVRREIESPTVYNDIEDLAELIKAQRGEAGLTASQKVEHAGHLAPDHPGRSRPALQGVLGDHAHRRPGIWWFRSH
jgi:Domain of unknown function (DUF4760)